MQTTLSRRSFLTAMTASAAAGLAGCAQLGANVPIINDGATDNRTPRANVDASYGGWQQMYAAVEDEGYQLPAIPIQKMDKRFLRQVVQDPTGEMPGTVVIDTANRFCYLVLDNGQAVRYGVGIGRDGFSWSGRAVIQYKRKWPRWTPPDEMVARQPELQPYSIKNGGMGPGLKNPLGARALYIFQNGVDTIYRLHGNPEWWSIGKAVSSGCVRFLNQDIMDLYNRVPPKSAILVM
ncbi:L,D-transpeptidase [Brucella sp. BE17]|uniref:L,D-transpeptidase n=1 Tax=Brucella sp. BE17 TaxID=3142977 RepID=UPI0031BB5012